MKTRYRLICRGIRGGAYYCVDTKTGKRTRLERVTGRFVKHSICGQISKLILNLRQQLFCGATFTPVGDFEHQHNLLLYQVY